MSSQIEAQSVSVKASRAKTRGSVLHTFLYSDLLALCACALLGFGVSQLFGHPVSLGKLHWPLWPHWVV